MESVGKGFTSWPQSKGLICCKLQALSSISRTKQFSLHGVHQTKGALQRTIIKRKGSLAVKEITMATRQPINRCCEFPGTRLLEVLVAHFTYNEKGTSDTKVI